MMNIMVLLPSKVLLKKRVLKINAEAINGHFTLLPKHIDFVAPLQTSILILTDEKEETYVAIDGGVLIKKEDDVWISTPRGMFGDDIDVLEQHIEEQWQIIKQTEEQAKSAKSKMESDVIRRYVEWSKG